jgi:ketosteroid isomerase-like protein
VRAARLDYQEETLASLGDSLALSWHLLAFEGFREAHLAEVGLSELAEIVLIEADERGRWIHVEIFAPERLGHAVARLYERYAEQAGAGAAATARITRAILVDPPDLETPVRGAEAIREYLRAMFEAEDFAVRVDDVLCLRDDAILFRQTTRGTLRSSGGAYERNLLSLWVCGGDGRLARIEEFDVAREAEALARFAELAAPVAPPLRFANAATRAVDRGSAAIAVRDWEGFASLFAPGGRHYDRTRMAQIESDLQAWLVSFRQIVEMTSAPPVRKLLATRGERLALFRMTWSGAEGDIGPSEIDWLLIVEVDDHGLHSAVVVHDPEDLDAAYAELDARYEAVEGAAYAAHHTLNRAFTRAIATGDWAHVVALCAPTFVEYDHRSLAVGGTTRGGEAWVQNFSTLVDLPPDTVMLFDHLRSAAGGYLFHVTWRGSREGGVYEIPLAGVIEVDERGRFARADIYDPEQLDEALARFGELSPD